MKQNEITNEAKTKKPSFGGWGGLVDNPFLSPTILSLCLGFLGLERGLQRTIGPVRVAAYVEIEAFIIANIIAGMQAGMVDAAPVYTDIKTFDARPFRGKIHGITGGYPCQPFSNAGKRKASADPRHLWPYIERIIDAARPVWCLFENVSAHLTLGFDSVYKSLSDMGYAVEAGVYSAQEAGAPHKREQLFILAIRKEWLGYAKEQGNIRQYVDETTRKQISTEFSITNRSDELADTADLSAGRNDREIQGTADQAEGKARQQYGQWMRPELSNIGENGELADTRLLGQAGASQQTEGIEKCDGGTIMDHTTIGRSEQISEFKTGGLSTQHAGKIVAYANGAGCADKGNDNQSHEANDAGTSDESTVLAHATGSRIQGLRTTGQQESAVQAGQELPGCNGEGIWNGWPAGQGSYQHEWEEKRTVESGMGCTIDGYNFREDLLRAYGNSVVEQTAEIAVVDLLNKHFSVASLNPSKGGT